MSIRATIAAVLLVAWVASVVGAGLWAYSAGRQRGQTSTQAQWLAERDQLIRTAEQAQAEREAERKRRDLAQQEASDEAERRTHELVEARAAADAAAERLRQRVAAISARCDRRDPHPTVAIGGASATDAVMVLADVLGRMEAAGRERAALADERGIAGAACERAYDEVSR